MLSEGVGHGAASPPACPPDGGWRGGSGSPGPEENAVTERKPTPLSHWPGRARVTPAPAGATCDATAPHGVPGP